MGEIRSHKDLLVYQKSMDLVVSIYQWTEKLPESEKYGLTNQIRRAVVSVVSNIAEGAGRQTHKEFIQFLYIALGSLNEVETQLDISIKLDYLAEDDVKFDELIHIRRMILKLIQNLKNRKK